MKCAPAGYVYDPELSDSRMAGFTDESGEQWYCKRSELAPCCCPEDQPSALCVVHSQLLEDPEVPELARKRGE